MRFWTNATAFWPREGRGLFIVPEPGRALGAGAIRHPFGFGRPYTLGQLEAMLAAIGLRPARTLAALFHPPTEKRFWLKTSGFWEKLAGRVSNRFAGGVLIWSK